MHSRSQPFGTLGIDRPSVTSCSKRCRTHLVWVPKCGVYSPKSRDRNRSEYEGDFYVDERLLADLITACKAVAAALERLPTLAS